MQTAIVVLGAILAVEAAAIAWLLWDFRRVERARADALDDVAERVQERGPAALRDVG